MDDTSDICKTEMEVQLSSGPITITPFVVKHISQTKGPLLVIKKRIEGMARVQTAQLYALHEELQQALAHSTDVGAAVLDWVESKRKASDELALADQVDYDAIAEADDLTRKAERVADIVLAAARGEEVPPDALGIDMAKLITECTPELVKLAAIAAGKPDAWAQDLGIDDLLVMSAAILKVNQERYSPKAEGSAAVTAVLTALLQ